MNTEILSPLWRAAARFGQMIPVDNLGRSTNCSIHQSFVPLQGPSPTKINWMLTAEIKGYFWLIFVEPINNESRDKERVNWPSECSFLHPLCAPSSQSNPYVLGMFPLKSTLFLAIEMWTLLLILFREHAGCKLNVPLYLIPHQTDSWKHLVLLCFHCVSEAIWVI